MHKNYRRKIKQNGSSFWTVPNCYRKLYWRRERARQRELLEKGRHDDFQDSHPKSILYDYW